MSFDGLLFAFLMVGLVLGLFGKYGLREAGDEGGSNGLVKVSGIMTWIAVLVIFAPGVTSPVRA